MRILIREPCRPVQHASFLKMWTNSANDCRSPGDNRTCAGKQGRKRSPQPPPPPRPPPTQRNRFSMSVQLTGAIRSECYESGDRCTRCSRRAASSRSPCNRRRCRRRHHASCRRRTQGRRHRHHCSSVRLLTRRSAIQECAKLLIQEQSHVCNCSSRGTVRARVTSCWCCCENRRRPARDSLQTDNQPVRLMPKRLSLSLCLCSGQLQLLS